MMKKYCNVRRLMILYYQEVISPGVDFQNILKKREVIENDTYSG